LKHAAQHQAIHKQLAISGP